MTWPPPASSSLISCTFLALTTELKISGSLGFFALGHATLSAKMPFPSFLTLQSPIQTSIFFLKTSRQPMGFLSMPCRWIVLSNGCRTASYECIFTMVYWNYMCPYLGRRTMLYTCCGLLFVCFPKGLVYSSWQIIYIQKAFFRT